MNWGKVIIFLFINTITRHFSIALESKQGDVHKKMSSGTVYTSFPFGLIFGHSKEIAAKNGQIVDEDIPLYDSEFDSSDFNKARGVYWIPSTCDSLLERGYTCSGCSESLHCMGGNFALKAICGGRRPYCYNGVCSDLRMEKCRRENLETPSTPAHDHDTIEAATLNTTVSQA